MSLALEFAIELLGSKDISFFSSAPQLLRLPVSDFSSCWSSPSPPPPSSYRPRQILSARLWCMATCSFHTINQNREILHKQAQEIERFKMQSWWSSSCKYELVLTLWAGHQNNSKFLAAVSSSLYLIWNFTRAISKGSCYFMTLWKNSARIFIGRKGRAHSSCALQSFLVQGDPQY